MYLFTTKYHCLSFIVSTLSSTGKRHQTKTRSLKVNPSKISSRGINNKYDPTTTDKRDLKHKEEMLKIVSEENQDVPFSLNKKRRWEMVEKLRKQDNTNRQKSKNTCTVRQNESVRIPAKFKRMKRCELNELREQAFKDSQSTHKEVIVEEDAFLVSTDKAKYRLDFLLLDTL